MENIERERDTVLDTEILREQIRKEEREKMLEKSREGGLKGGNITKQRGVEYYKNIGKKGAESRWGKKT